MPALTAQHLRKSFGPQVVLDDATFTLARGEKVGLIGANGAGKSTLAKILAGVEKPDGGTVSVRRGLTVRYLAQEPELDPRASARAVVEDALTAWRAATSRHAEVTAALSDPGRAAEFTRAHRGAGGARRRHPSPGRLGPRPRGAQLPAPLGVRDVERPCGDAQRRRAAAHRSRAAPRREPRRRHPRRADQPSRRRHRRLARGRTSPTTSPAPSSSSPTTATSSTPIAQRIVELERGRLADVPRQLRRLPREEGRAPRPRGARRAEPAEHPPARARVALARAEGAQDQAEGAHPARARARGAGPGDRGAARRGRRS